MADVWVAAAVMHAVAAALYAGLHRATGAWSRSRALGAAAAVTLLLLCYLTWVQETAWLAIWLPLQPALIYGRWVPLFAAALAALLWPRLPATWYRRYPAVVLLLAVAWYQSFGDLVAPRFRNFANVWSDGVCIQSNDATCSAASAATILKTVGLDTTEAAMAGACLTTTRGTTFHGLLRGLAKAVEGTDYTCVPFGGRGLSELKQEVAKGPVIIWVRLDPGPEVDIRYQRDWGWVPGVAHAVVLFRFLPKDRVEIGDPSVGREVWHVRGLRDLWHGEGVALRKKDH